MDDLVSRRRALAGKADLTARIGNRTPTRSERRLLDHYNATLGVEREGHTAMELAHGVRYVETAVAQALDLPAQMCTSAPAWLKCLTLNEMPNFSGAMARPRLSTGLVALNAVIAARRAR